MFKKSLSVILVVFVLAGSVFLMPAVSAETKSNADSTAPNAGIKNSNVNVKGTNSFGNMLSDKIDGKTQEQEENNGNNIFAVEMNNNIATVEFETTEDAVIVVGIFDESGNNMLCSGKSEVTEEDKTAQVTVTSGEIPQYYVVKVFMTDSQSNKPLCESFESTMYTQEMQELLSKTTDDFDSEDVLNLDNDKKDNFAVFNDDTNVIQNTDDSVNVVTLVDDENNIYKIKNADESITSLKHGEVFSYSYGDNNVLIVKVDTITTEGDITTITGAKLDMEDVFEFVKIDGSANTGEAKVDTTESDEGVTYNGIKTEQSFKKGDKKSKNPTGIGGEGSITGELDFDLLKDEEESDSPCSLSGGVNLKLEASVKFYFTSLRQYFELKLEYTAKTYAKLEFSPSIPGLTAKLALPLGKLMFMPVAGVSIELKPEFVVEIKASIEVNAQIKGCVGFSVSNTGGLKNLTSKPEADFKTKIKGSIFVGFKFTPSVNVLIDAAKAAISGTIGAEASAEVDKGNDSNNDISGAYESGVGDVTARVATSRDKDSEHDCKVCIKGDISAKAELSAKATILNIDKLTWKGDIYSISIKLTDFHYSMDFNEWGLCKCPHKRNKITFAVFDENCNPAQNVKAEVYYIDKDKHSHRCIETNTDQKGIAAFMLSAGKYKVRFTADTITVTKKIEVDEKAETVKVMLSENAGMFDFGQCGDDAFYTLRPDGTLTITGTGDMYDYEMNYKDGKAYTNAPWFKKRNSIKNIVIENGITSIGTVAFLEFAKNLKTITIPPSITEIKSSFDWQRITSDDSKMTGVYISDINAWCNIEFHGVATNPLWFAHKLYLNNTLVTSVEIQGSYVKPHIFAGCKSITSVRLPNRLESISIDAFRGCKNLRSINIPSSLQYIGDFVFADCEKLTNVVLPESLNILGESAFAGCKSLKTINIPAKITRIPLGCFENSGLEQITIPSNVTTIEGRAFNWCERLSNIDLPNTLTAIGGSAFSGCSSLKSFNIPDRITTIPVGCFMESGLESISIPDTIETIESSAFAFCEKLKSVELSKKISEIKGYTFVGCTALSEISIPNTVTKIGEYAFHQCTSLKEIDIPDNVNYVADAAFRFCTSLQKVKLSETLPIINPSTFENCSSLHSIYISKNTTMIMVAAFENCNSLTDIYYSGSEDEWSHISGIDTGDYQHNTDDIFANANIHYYSTADALLDVPLRTAVNKKPPKIESDKKSSAAKDNKKAKNKTEAAPEDDNPYSRSGLVPNTEALLIVVDNASEDYTVKTDSLLYIAQTTVGENGKAEFSVNVEFGDRDYTAVIFGYCSHEKSTWSVATKATPEENGMEICICDNCSEVIDTRELDYVPDETVDPDKEQYICGDINLDNAVDINDVTLLQLYLVQRAEISDDVLETADLNEDGKVNIRDATTIQMYLAGYTIPYKVGQFIDKD